MPEMSDDQQMGDEDGPVPDEPVRHFGWSNMFVHPDEDPRSEGGFTDERTLLAEYLHDQRLTLELKCSDLDADALARRAVPPSNLSLLGLVRHMAEVERNWFRRRMAGEEAPRRYQSEADPDRDFNGAVADPDVVAEAWAAWRSEVDFAERFVAGAPDLGLAARNPEVEVTLREVLLHMVEEYARHNGHADFLRERIDGRVGQ
ncbi:MAG TPA: DinB family protein [Jiangellales bacterium]|nr:DinB family protein [Jiangellales bacterium]